MNDAQRLSSVHLLVRSIEIAGVAIIVLGMAISLSRIARDSWVGARDGLYSQSRAQGHQRELKGSWPWSRSLPSVGDATG